MENAFLISLDTGEGQRSIDVLKRAAKRLGLCVCQVEVCAFGQSQLVRQLFPGEYALVDNLEVVGDQSDLHKILSRCYWGAIDFVYVKSETEMYSLIPSLTPGHVDYEMVEILA